MDEQTTNLFQKFDETIIKLLTTATDGKMEFYGSLMASLFTSAFTVYLLFNAYQIIAGKHQKPLEDLTYNIVKLGIIALFVTNAGGWLDLSITALNGLKTGLSGTDNVWLSLDQLWFKAQQVAGRIMQLDKSTVPLSGAVGACLTWVGTIIALVVTSMVFLSAEVTILLLTVTAPIFVFCLMFGFLRQMFSNWLQAIFSAILTVTISSLIVLGTMRILNNILSQLVIEADKSNLLTMGAMAAATGVVSGGLVIIASRAAGQIAGVSVNAAVQGMAMVGLGLGAGVAAKAAMGATRSVAGGTKGAGHGLFEGGAGRKLDEKKSRGASAMIGYGAARGTRAVVQKIQQRRARKKEALK